MKKYTFNYKPLLLVISVFTVTYFLQTRVFITNFVPSASMENTLMTGAEFIALIPGSKNPGRGDIITFAYPDDETQTYVKRVIGLPGETVTIKDGNVYIDDVSVPLNEPYLKEPMTGTFGPYTVPEGCYFCMGDNRNNSRDSRYWDNTFVKQSEIYGKAILQYYPRIKLINGL